MRKTILFTGHMIDKKDRENPRFPESKELVVVAELRKRLVEEKLLAGNKIIIGLAGGACGGDIIFHEVCEEIGIQSEIYLAFPVDEYKKRSVSFAGKKWDLRFDRLIKRLPVHILPKDKRFYWFSTGEELCRHLKNNPVVNSYLLVKGSRVNKLEQVVDFL